MNDSAGNFCTSKRQFVWLLRWTTEQGLCVQWLLAQRVESGAFQLLLHIPITELKGEVCQLQTKVFLQILSNYCICEKEKLYEAFCCLPDLCSPLRLTFYTPGGVIAPFHRRNFSWGQGTILSTQEPYLHLLKIVPEPKKGSGSTFQWPVPRQTVITS